MLSRTLVKKVIESYGKAWVDRDPDIIPQIFTADAVYTEWAFDKPYKGHKEIMDYWKRKVVGEQSDITFKLLDFFIDKERDIVVAEYETRFYINNSKKKNHMIEVGVMQFHNGKIRRLREYWANREE
jgi:ketosteroid isomerase-like protein